jgi:putative ABC transport system ATP-binding protein
MIDQHSATTAALVTLHDVEKVYQQGRVEYRALRGVDLSVEGGEMVSIVGPSGSGKSTILNVITGIDRASDGSVIVDGQDLSSMSEDELARWRGTQVGIVFQFFQLLPTLTALENVILPLEFAGRGDNSERERIGHAKLELVGLIDKPDRFPAELSGGEQQRVAIARALVCDPVLLVADEPTGNLDTETAWAMLDMLADVNATGTTIIYVTHDRELASRAPRTVTIRDGVVVGATGGRDP